MKNDQLIELTIALRMSTFANENERPYSVRFDDSEEIKKLSSDSDALQQRAKVCNLAVAIELNEECTSDTVIESIRSSHEKNGTYPQVVAIKGQGLFALAPNVTDVISIVDSIKKSCSYKAISKEHRRMHGCISAVTGSAQGFGRGIAEELAREGAYVVIADLNEKLGNDFSNELNQMYGAGTSIFCRCDVTSLESIDQLVQNTVKSFGGLDMLISNAGVLKAGGLHEMDESAFDLVTDVNYKAYFLCTKAVTPIFKLQHKLNANHFMDIIQINSKSGLQGSNKNFAYAGSKFGGIGLTQSFAMELIEYSVKVNSICPGNYFEGPLWSDPEKGLFVQYLRTGKVPGAKTIEDVKKSYTDKVPMKRGCWPSDVARAIFYIFEQKYETGQAIPVTGGQVMLS